MDENKRLIYFDILRGISMNMVVYYHINDTIFNNYGTIISNYFGNVMLPLFFFISGFFAWKNKIGNNYRFIINKITELVIPAIICMSIWDISFDRNIIEAFFDNYKNGYWFTIVLAEMLIIMHIINRTLINKSKKYKNIVLLLIVIILNIIVKINQLYLFTDNELLRFFSSFLFFLYFQFFIFGCLFKINFNSIIHILEHYKMFFPILFFIYCSLLKYDGYYQSCVRSYINVIFLFYLFYYYKNNLNNFYPTKIMLILGKYTKQIYFIHYFLLFGLMYNFSSINYITNLINIPLLELIINGILSLIICFVCIYISKAVRISLYMNNMLFGFKVFKE